MARYQTFVTLAAIGVAIMLARPAKAGWDVYGYVITGITDYSHIYGQVNFSDASSALGGGCTASVSDTWDSGFVRDRGQTVSVVWQWTGSQPQPTVGNTNVSGAVSISGANTSFVYGEVFNHKLGKNWRYSDYWGSYSDTSLGASGTFPVTLQSNNTVKSAGISWYYSAYVGYGDSGPASGSASAVLGFTGPY